MKWIAVTVVWIGMIVAAILEAPGLVKDSQELNLQSSSFTILALLVPIAVGIALGLWLTGYPFDIPSLRARVNSRWGANAYEDFCRAFKFMALLATASLVLGCTLFWHAHQGNAGEGAYAIAGFFISGAIGVVIIRALLKRRGLLME